MEDFLKIISHVRRFKTATKGLSIEDLAEVKAKLEKIIEDRITAEADAKRKNAEKIEKIEKYREMLAADGIEPDELLDEAGAKKGKRATRPPKYEIKDEKGKSVTWTGQGRMPNVFKARIEAGDSIDSFLIK
jgi:DNA-binding protein H-NS